jgi:raffinose/stachyose/melibiose transport system permease protein
VLVALCLLVIIIIQLLPFYIALTTALKPKTDFSSEWVFPTSLYFGNFELAVSAGNILRAMLNSALVTVVTTALVCLIGALAAYPLARRRTVGNRLILVGIVGLLMIPPLSILVPLYTFLTQIHGVNTYWGEILVMLVTQLPLAIFLYANFIRTVPESIEEAAVMDGANILQTLFLVVFPVLKPVTATVIILTSVAVWNEYALSVFILGAPEVRTIAPSISSFFSTQSSNLGSAAAASLIAVLPVLIVYLVLQRYFIKGMVAGAEK